MIRWCLPVAVAAVLVGGCAPGTHLENTSPGAPPQATHTPVPVYHRSEFGTGWARQGHCTTRQIVLARDAGPTATETGDRCRDSGPIVDLYTGRVITPQQAQIDHVYPLERAWVAGAWRWTPGKRREFANDTRNLRAVSATGNEAKGDLGPAQWRPPSRSGWCLYARTYEGTATNWALPVSAADQVAIQDMEKTC